MSNLLDLSVCPPPDHRQAYERQAPRHEGLDKWLHRFNGAVLRSVQKLLNPADISVRPIHKARAEFLQSGSVDSHLQTLRYRLRHEGLRSTIVVQALALADIVCEQTLQKQAYATQFKGAWALLGGRLAEMATGEGKSLTAALAVSVAAMAGLKVHVVTVNDYLAQRDARYFKPLYERLGLTVAGLEHEFDLSQRSAAYHCDILYCSNKELAFDYLKQKITGGEASVTAQRLTGGTTERSLMPGLYFAIVDEADSVMVDEARTPLIISAPDNNTDNPIILSEALELAGELQENRDFTLKDRNVRLTPAGEQHLEQLSDIQNWPWCLPALRAEIVEQALTALHVYHCGQEYIVQNGQVHIVDEYTGRVLEGRSWEQGLHQLIELKEGLECTRQNKTIARISYQQLFRKYHFLSGMTGTGAEVRDEFWRIYDLPTSVIPPRKKLLRRFCGYKILQNESAKWAYLASRVEQCRRQGQPVLIGVRSVKASEQAEQALSERGLNVQVLNAVQAEREAEIIARAGRSGIITIATNMAGRGTDIALDKTARAAGGLHVILTELHEASRIDRQLYGRCARQGDPGSYEMILSLDDELPVKYFKAWQMQLARKTITLSLVGQYLLMQQFRLAQKHIEKINRQQRFQLFEQGLQKEQMLAFSGKHE